MSIDLTQKHVRILGHDEQIDRAVPRPHLNHSITELFAFCSTLRDAGHDLGPAVEKAEVLWDAVVETTQPDPQKYLTGLMELDAEGIAERARLATNSRIATELEQAGRTQNIFGAELRQAAGDAMRENADDIVRDLRKKFDTNMEVIRAAAACGITKHAKPGDLLHSGAAEAIEAFRRLPAAVTELESIATTRIAMSQILSYGPYLIDYPAPRDSTNGNAAAWDVAAFVTGLGEDQTLDSARGHWEGATEHVQVDEHGGYYGSGIQELRIMRIGGRWLDLTSAGYTVHLNTAAEATAVIDSAPTVA